MSKRDAPSRHDRKGVKPRRTRANAENDRLGLYLVVPQRTQGAGTYFSAHTRETLPPAERGRRGRKPRRAVASDLAFVHVLCRCGEYEVRMRADIAARGVVPRCSMACESLAVKREAAEKREQLKAEREARDDAPSAIDVLEQKIARKLARRRRGQRF